METPPAINVRNLSATFRTTSGPLPVLRSTTFALPPGSRVGLTGPSGCGKTTLARLLAGILEPSHALSLSGDITITRDSAPTSPALLKRGLIFQEPTLLPWRSVFQNVLLPAELDNTGPDQEERAEELLAQFGLGAFSTSPVWTLSGGMQQRVAFCRALLLNPTLLILDEPFSALDVPTKALLSHALLAHLKIHPATLLLISHHTDDLLALSDTVIVLTPRPGSVAASFTVSAGADGATKQAIDDCILQLTPPA